MNNVVFIWTSKVFEQRNKTFTSNFGDQHILVCARFSYLLLFRTWRKATRPLRPRSQALYTPLGRHRWRSHHHTPSPTLHCRKPPRGPHSVSASPRRDVAGSQGCQSLTGRCTARTARRTERSKGQLGAAWCHGSTGRYSNKTRQRQLQSRAI